MFSLYCQYYQDTPDRYTKDHVICIFKTQNNWLDFGISRASKLLDEKYRKTEKKDLNLVQFLFEKLLNAI